ncbi:hypothetical protein L1987_60623 [Smallanthus sonchifolius]|uniref:Uncharacterized protein n=1 Tax=Smallanthus sonchifolius TaxID=185202 RepID=A0ACB9D8I4_9ASTR|nr:hypothetical protein L1987_60623 [Smallanthus sonchifolius]
MPHLRSQGPPPAISLDSQSDSKEYSEASHSEVSVSLSSPSSSTSSPSSVSSPLSNSSTPSSPPPFHPDMANRRTVHQQSTAGFTGINNPITVPNITNENSWQIPSYIMTAINNCQFNGRDDEDAPVHIARLTRICGTFNLQGATDDAIFLHLFPFSLAGRAATWLDSHPPGTFTTWADLRDAFLNKYFPPAKAARLRDEIHSFRMPPDEPYYMAWERFQNLLSRCSQHGLSDWALVEKFYNGLTYETRARFDTSVGGHLMGKRNVAECNDMFESFAQAEYEQRSVTRNSSPSTSTSSSSRGVHHVNVDTSVAAALEALAKDVKELKMRVARCEVCRGDHATVECPVLNQEKVGYVGGQNRYGNSYNPNWGNHQNPSFRSSGNPPGFHSNFPQNQGQCGQSSGSNSGSTSVGGGASNLGRIEKLLTQLVAKDASTQKILHVHDILLKNQQSAFLDLQRTVGDIAKRLDKRPEGQFPSGTQPNPNAHVNAVTTRSGRGGELLSSPVEVEKEPVDDEVERETPGRVHSRLVPASTAPNSESLVGKSVEMKPVDVRPTHEIDLARIPYPERLANQKHAKEYGHFLDMFKQLKINLPFIDALQRMPKYAKFLKDLLKGKDRLGKLNEVPLSRECSVVITNTLPEKLTDPGIFTIPCLFGGDVRSHALADSGASINLMPYSLYEKLALGELAPTCMTLSLADRSIKCPRGILENVLVKVDKFVFPVDFVVMDMEADTTVSIILGRPFLRTAKAVIDVFDGKLTLRVGDETVTFVVAKSINLGGSGDSVDNPKCGDVKKKPGVMMKAVGGEMWEAGESGSFSSEWEEFSIDPPT